MIIFGINSNNRKWMMRPDQMFLSWSFGFLLLSTIASFISAAFLCCISYTDRATQVSITFETNFAIIITELKLNCKYFS